MTNKIRTCCNNDCNQGRYCELRALEKNKKNIMKNIDQVIIALVIIILAVLLTLL